MIDTSSLPPFVPNTPDTAGVISWVHIGDLHMTLAGEQNHLDLLSIVNEVNEVFADSLSFVFIPGDIADQGSVSQYEVVRAALDQLKVPWCSIVGDHDVHEKSFANFLHFMAAKTHYSFQVGSVVFFAINAFDVPDPGSFVLLSDQLVWLEESLGRLESDQAAVLFLHCYPTDLKQGGGRLRELVAQLSVRLIEMGHTHYNEVANDGSVLYIATRSTGQIEEGPAGYSVTNIDGPVISWKFLPIGALPAVMITSPADERFVTEQHLQNLAVTGTVHVRAKAWGNGAIRSAKATLVSITVQLTQIAGSHVWGGEFRDHRLADGIYPLAVEVTDEHGNLASDEMRIVLGEAAYQSPQRSERDQNNALDAWPERGLIGTQLGPNKFGKKW